MHTHLYSNGSILMHKMVITGYYTYIPACYTSISVLARLADQSPIDGNQ